MGLEAHCTEERSDLHESWHWPTKITYDWSWRCPPLDKPHPLCFLLVPVAEQRPSLPTPLHVYETSVNADMLRLVR